MSYIRKQKDGYVVYENENGKTISTANDRIILQDGFVFRDLTKTGQLLPYVDWRLSDEDRAKDLADRLSVDQIAGLMMYSSHQNVPGRPFFYMYGTYDGKMYDDTDVAPWTMSDQQKQFLSEDNIRHVLAVNYENTETAVRWNNILQAFCENEELGIPVNISTDPRNGASKAGAEFKTGGNDISKWPEGLGMAATFDPQLCQNYANIISKEYRALGIATALSPQIDLATEPRWYRFEDTFGSHPQLVTDMARAYCDGMQTTDGSAEGWGNESVSAMAKHWPGGGTGEGGRDAHFAFGSYAVYPANRFQLHLKSFIEGAFKLNGPTQRVSSIMPYYTVSYDMDTIYGRNVGNSYSRYMIDDLLREKYGFNGIVCTDWGITDDPAQSMYEFGSKCFGVEDLSVDQRHLLAIENGVDQFGGNNDKKPILAAYRMGVEKYGEEAFEKRFRKSAYRLLLNMFRLGLFENPFLDVAQSQSVVACEEFCKSGYDAQLKSVVMLKNHNNVLPLKTGLKGFTPIRHIGAKQTFMLTPAPPYDTDPADTGLYNKYFERVESTDDADFALVFIESPLSDPYHKSDLDNGGNGYLPITLQYRPYTAHKAREVSIAGGDFREKSTNRSYKGKTNCAANENDLDLVINARKAMGDKPVIVVVRMHNSAVLAELEPYADAIICEFGVQQQAIFDIISGKVQPSGLLPIQLPADMDTVETHCEDLPFDMTAYTDSDGNTYDFGFGMNWDGPIHDERNQKYTKFFE